MTPEAERLLQWHIAELETLLGRCVPGEFVYPLIEARLVEAYEALVEDI